MANIIAVIWDCDKTLIDGYMQDPIFKEYGVNSGEFWKEVNAIPDQYAKQSIRVNKDTYYLNHFIRCAHNGTFPGLNNEKLREYGSKQRFYKGIPEIFEKYGFSDYSAFYRAYKKHFGKSPSDKAALHFGAEELF